MIPHSADKREHAVAAFVASKLGVEATRVERLEAFATNAVYEVDSGGQRFVVKASLLHDALQAEAWACAQGAAAGCAAPAILAVGPLSADGGMSAFIMPRVPGLQLTAAHPALSEVGAQLRRLHAVKLPGFGFLAEAARRGQDDFALRHDSWLGFARGICADTLHLADRYALAAPVAAATAARIEIHAGALAAIEVGSLCHGDLKPAHILIDADRLAGIIDWGDAVVADPIWDIARFAQRVDEEALSCLLAGYDLEHALVDELRRRIPLYRVLWMLVDALVDHRLGGRADVALEAAQRELERA